MGHRGTRDSVMRLKLALAVLLSLALMAYLLSRVDLGDVGAQLARTRWGWVVLGMGAGLLGLYARAARWRYLFPPASLPSSLVPATMIGYMANNLLPFRAGEVIRVYVVARRWHRGFWTALATLVVERVLDSIAIVLLLGGLVLLLPVPALFRNAALVLLVIDVAAVAALVALTKFPAGGRTLIGRLRSRWPTLEARLARAYDTFVHGLDGIRAPQHRLPLVGWTIVVWTLPALAAWATLRAVDLDLPWLAGWVVLAFVGLGVAIPSAPGYVGVFHVAAAKAVELFGADPSAGVAFAIVFHASQYVVVTLAGWVYLVREGLSLAEAARAAVPVGEHH